MIDKKVIFVVDGTINALKTYYEIVVKILPIKH